MKCLLDQSCDYEVFNGAKGWCRDFICGLFEKQPPTSNDPNDDYYYFGDTQDFSGAEMSDDASRFWDFSAVFGIICLGLAALLLAYYIGKAIYKFGGGCCLTFKGQKCSFKASVATDAV